MRCYLLAALALSAPVTTVVLPAAVQAQAGQPISRPLTAIRLLGGWTSRAGQMRFSSNEGKDIAGEMWANGRTYKFKVVNDPNAVGVWIEWEKNRAASEQAQVGRILLVPTADGNGIVMSELTSQPPIWGGGELVAQRMSNGESAQYYGHLVGEWETSFGPADVSIVGGHAFVNMTTPSLRRLRPAETWTVAFALHDGLGGEKILHGAWERTISGARVQGRAEWALSADRKSWSGSRFGLVDGSNKEAWTGKRSTDDGSAPPEPAPQPVPPPSPPPSPTPPPVITPAPPPLPTAGAFKPLRRVDVRLDRLWEARGYPTRQVHAFVTIKNISAQPQYLTSGYLKAVLTDEDGVAQERNQLWRASAEPAALFASTPVVQPGAELKVRYVFNPDEGARPASLALSEGDQRAVFPATGL